MTEKSYETIRCKDVADFNYKMKMYRELHGGLNIFDVDAESLEFKVHIRFENENYTES